MIPPPVAADPSALELGVVAVTISLDTFAAAIALGTHVPRSHWLRLALIFAVVGGVAPLLGITLGTLASGILSSIASGLGILVLAALGGWFLHTAFAGGPETSPQLPGMVGWTRRHLPAVSNPAHGSSELRATGSVVLLAMGLSSDNVLVGLGLGLQGGAPAILGGITAVSVFGATLTGLALGALGMARFGRGAIGMAGVLLLGLALAFLLRWV